MKCPDCGRDLERKTPEDFVEDDRSIKVTEYKRCECGKEWAWVYSEELGVEQIVRQ